MHQQFLCLLICNYKQTNAAILSHALSSSKRLTNSNVYEYFPMLSAVYLQNPPLHAPPIRFIEGFVYEATACPCISWGKRWYNLHSWYYWNWWGQRTSRKQDEYPPSTCKLNGNDRLLSKTYFTQPNTYVVIYNI